VVDVKRSVVLPEPGGCLNLHGHVGVCPGRFEWPPPATVVPPGGIVRARQHRQAEPRRNPYRGTRPGGSGDPEQISHQLPTEFPGELGRHVVHETIYQALYLQGRGMSAIVVRSPADRNRAEITVGRSGVIDGSC